jgi:hypothetical protein
MAAVIARGFRRAALPLVCYYAITLGLPLINGAGKAGPRFLNHAFVVLVVPIVLVALVSAVCAMARRVAQSRLSSHSRVTMR